MDWLMKPLDGLEFLRMVRTAPDTPNPFLPTIMLTAYSELHRVALCRDSGVTAFMTKPFSPTNLYQRIATVIEDRRCFVRSPDFFGPDRRWAERPIIGPDRRRRDSAEFVEI